MPSSFVHATAAATSSGTQLALTVPGGGEDGVKPKHLALAHLYLGNSASDSAFVGAPPGQWKHAYGSPLASQTTGGGSPHWHHAAFLWRILTQGDLGEELTFTRAHSGGDSFRGFISVWSNPRGFNAGDPFDVKLVRDTGLVNTSVSQHGQVPIREPGDIAIQWVAAETYSSGGGNWGTGGQWTRVRSSQGGTDGIVDSHYIAEAGDGVSPQSANYFSLTNNKFLHWAFTLLPQPGAVRPGLSARGVGLLGRR